MKKVLLSSLVAVMAVTSANAKIASTNYVDQAAGAAQSAAEGYTDRKTGAVNTLATDTNLKVVNGVADLTAAVKKLDEAVALASGDLGKLGALATLNTVGTGQIDNNAVTADKLAADSVTTAKIANANVTADKLAANSVTTAKIVDSNVTTAKIADSNVTTAKIANAAVTTAKIADAAVTEAKLDTTLAKKINDTTSLSQANKQAIEAMTGEETGILTQAKKYTDDEIKELSDGAVARNTVAIGQNAASINTINNSDAMKSGITAAKVATYDSYADGKQDALNPAQLAAVDSGIDTEKVAQIATNTDGIAANKAAMATNSQNIAKNTQAIGGITNAKDAEDGNYVLTKKVVDGVATYAWEQIDRDLAN